MENGKATSAGVEGVEKKASPSVVYVKPVSRTAGSGSAWYLPVVFGRDQQGNLLSCDLATAPHVAIGGDSGDGAPQFLRNAIEVLAKSRTPEELKFVLIDINGEDLAPFANLPSLGLPIINKTSRAVFALMWAVEEMGNRLKMFSAVCVKDIASFNSRDPNAKALVDDDSGVEVEDLPATLPYIVIAISDFDELVAQADPELADCISRLAALSRAAGIHLILETKHIDGNTLPEVIMANIPVRVAFRTASEKGSEQMLGEAGAESLIGDCEALVKYNDGKTTRVQTMPATEVEIAQHLG